MVAMGKPGYLSFQVDPADYARLAEVAERKGYNLSEMARKCLRVGLRLAEDFEPKDTDHLLERAGRHPPRGPRKGTLSVTVPVQPTEEAAAYLPQK
jgi:hypothetical protein